MASPQALLVEDEFMIGMLLESYAEAIGIQIAAVVSTLSEGLEAARSQDFDLAILDVNLNGEASFPIADVLAERGVPFVFSTGYGEAVCNRFPNRPVLRKPYHRCAFQKAMTALVGEAA